MPAKKSGVPANQIRRLRDGKGLSQVKLAELVGMSSQNLGRIEKGLVNLGEEWVGKFASALQCAPADLYDNGDGDLLSIPLIAWVSAGGLAHASTSMLHEVPMVQMGGLEPGEYFATTVKGDSMDRLSPEGSVIVVNRADRHLVNGRPYVFSFRGETTYKLWFSDPDQLAPHSINPVHRPIFPKRESDWEVIGRVRRSILDM